MAGGLPLGIEVSNGTSVGADLTSSNGTAVTPNASANTMGSFAQLVASTAIDTCFMSICVLNPGSGAYAVDIAVGGSGSEVVIIQGLLISNAVILNFCQHYIFPVSIPAGTRIAARCQSATASDSACNVQIQIFDGAFTMMEGAAGVDALGLVTASTQGTQVDAGAAANTKGAYSQLVASTARDYMGFVPAFDNLNNLNSALSSNAQLIDIAVGGAGSEIVIVPNILVRRSDGGSVLLPPSSALFPVPIPAGSRISARSQSSNNTSPSRLAGVTLYGIYQ